MKPILSMLIALVLSLSLQSCAPGEKSPSQKALKSDSERFGYALGMDIGASLREIREDIDIDSFTAGLRDTLEGRKALLTPDEAAEIRKEFSTRMRDKQAEKSKGLAEKNLQEGKAFLSENAGKDEVITTESGLQYLVMNQGHGPKPIATDQVKVHYRGTLLDG
ncbi:MAG: FKBP-type peptidyl-prolyl cis-trans isomerase N-terminal domain-containing protein, partial [Candidatus Latescibacterota bacterium]